MVPFLLAIGSLVLPVHAATVAVLGFDGYGASFDDTETVTQGLRDALTQDGHLLPLSGTDISDGLTGTNTGDLQSARVRVSEARKLYQARRAEDALPALDEAIDLHYQALSDVGRRPELADAWYLKALCLIALGRDDEAYDAFVETTYLYPKYIKDRATSMPQAAISPAARAQAAVETGRRRIRSADSIRDIGGALNADYVIVGYIDDQRDLMARIYQDGQLVDEQHAELSELPAPPVDDAYGLIVTRLVAATRPAPTIAASRTSKTSVPTTTGRTRPTIDESPAEAPQDDRAEKARIAREEKAAEEEERVAREQRAAEEERVARAERAAAAKEAADRAADKEREEKARAGRTSTSSSKTPSGRTTSSKTTAAPPPDEAPDGLTHKWWFWTALGAGVGGIGAFIGYELVPAPTEEVTGPPGWSVAIDD